MPKDAMTYEIGYLLKPSLKEEEVLAFTEKLRNSIVGKTGLIISEGAAKNLALAYTIKKEETACFNWLKFLLQPESIKEVEESLKKDDSVLRFLTIKAKEKTRKAKPPKPKIKRIKIAPRPKETEEPAPEKPAPEPSIKEEEIDKKIEELLKL